jgi:hypothetical protein
VFTLNNPTAEVITQMQKYFMLNARWVIWRREVGPVNGRTHLQGFVVFHKPVRWSYTLKDQFPWWIAPKAMLSSYQDQVDYISKDGPIDWEFGVRPADPNDRRAQGGKTAAAIQQALFAQFFEMAKSGRMMEIRPDYLIRYYTTWVKIQKENLGMPASLTHVSGVWIWGPSGSGKSSHARDLFRDAYIKPTTKWWDGYVDHQQVIIDDLDPSHAWLAYLLKIWTDRYAFIAEVKGCVLSIRPEVVCITSQFSIDQIWENDPETVQALKRRCQVRYWQGGGSTIRKVPKVQLQRYEDIASISLTIEGMQQEAAQEQAPSDGRHARLREDQQLDLQREREDILHVQKSMGPTRETELTVQEVENQMQTTPPDQRADNRRPQSCSSSSRSVTSPAKSRQRNQQHQHHQHHHHHKHRHHQHLHQSEPRPQQHQHLQHQHHQHSANREVDRPATPQSWDNDPHVDSDTEALLDLEQQVFDERNGGSFQQNVQVNPFLRQQQQQQPDSGQREQGDVDDVQEVESTYSGNPAPMRESDRWAVETLSREMDDEEQSAMANHQQKRPRVTDVDHDQKWNPAYTCQICQNSTSACTCRRASSGSGRT